MFSMGWYGSLTASDTDKGQLISKCLYGVFNSSKKRTKKFDYDTSGQIVFVCFLEEFKTSKRHFEIN